MLHPPFFFFGKKWLFSRVCVCHLCVGQLVINDFLQTIMHLAEHKVSPTIYQSSHKPHHRSLFSFFSFIFSFIFIWKRFNFIQGLVFGFFCRYSFVYIDVCMHACMQMYMDVHVCVCPCASGTCICMCKLYGMKLSIQTPMAQRWEFEDNVFIDGHAQ